MIKPKHIAIIGLILVLLGGGVLIFKKKQGHVRRPIDTTLPPDEQTAMADREILDDPNASDYEVMGALLRLTVRKEPKIRQQLNVRVKSSSKVLRAAVADALGNYDDAEAIGSIKELLADPEEMVRIRALQGLSHKRNKEREEIISQHLSKKNLSSQEQLEASAALVAAGESKESSEAALNTLIQVVAKGEKGLSRDAMVKVVGMAPQNQKTIDFCRLQVKSGKDPQVQSIAIRHLATFDSSWINVNYDALKMSPEVGIRLAVVESLHAACPLTRWNILKAVIQNEKEKSVQTSVIQEAVMMPGPDAVNFLNGIVDSFKGKDPALVDQAKKGLETLRSTKNTDHCKS